MALPAERAGRRGLVAAIDADGVVCGRAPKTITLRRVGNVGVSSRIDQDLALAQPRYQTENVGMAVAAGAFSKRPGFDDEVDVAAGHDGHVPTRSLIPFACV